MNPTTPRRPLLGVVALVVLTAGRAGAEPELPPERPTTPYRAEVRNSYEIREAGGGKSGADTLEIHVSGPRLFERSKLLDEKSVIVDTEKREVLEFDEQAAGDERVAAKFALNDTPIPYVHGRTALAAFDTSWEAPKIAGEDKVAKQKCTVLHYGNPAESGVAACVSKDGVVLRAKIVFPDYEREFEVLDFDAGKQDEKWFQPPEGFRLAEGAP